MRTIVVSDIHGTPQLLENALAAAGEYDRLIIAGDLLDIGFEPRRSIELAEELGAEVLFGNHEVAALLGLVISPQNPDVFEKFQALLAERVGSWQLAAVADDVIVTHAGLSDGYSDWFAESGSNVNEFCRQLNEQFRDEAWAASDGEGFSLDSLLVSDDGPLWFRPSRYAPHRLLDGVTQVAGHTAPELRPAEVASIARHGLHLIDPNARGRAEVAGWYRYAVIDDGLVTVVNAELDSGE